MTELASHTRRAVDVLDGLSPRLTGEVLLERLLAYCEGLDLLGRDGSDGSPVVGAEALLALLTTAVPEPEAIKLVEELERLDSARLLRSDETAAPLSWFELAARVPVLDSDDTASFEDLDIPDDAPRWMIVDAVQQRFPSLEDELVDPEVMPPAIEAAVTHTSEDEGQSQRLSELFDEVARQLGWWAALALVLSVPPAYFQQERAHGRDVLAGTTHPWPLFVFVEAAAIGGWTLTVVDSCVLAPRASDST